jgi:predicted NBD/HSP70 family sugar kinase
MHAGKPKILKKNNRRLVLDLLRKSGGLTIPEISKETMVSKTTIIKIIDHFTGTGIVLFEGKGESTGEGGKRPGIFKFNERYGYAMGFHIFPDELFAAITDLNSTILSSLSIPLERDENINTVIDKIITSHERLMEKEGIDPEKCIGLGIGLPGIIDIDKGIVHTSPRFPSWGIGAEFRDILLSKLKLKTPVLIDNEGRFQVFAEKIKGLAREKKNIISIEAGIGLVAGIIVKDEIKRGAHFLAGEIGHMIINPNDQEECLCGGRGCFEVMVSTNRLLKNAKESYREYRGTTSIQEIFNAANSGDMPARHLMDEVIRWFAIAISNIIVMYDPDIIIIQGIYTKAGNYFIRNLRRKVNDVALLKIKKDVDIEYSGFGKERCVLGSASYVIAEYFKGDF